MLGRFFPAFSAFPSLDVLLYLFSDCLKELLTAGEALPPFGAALPLSGSLQEVLLASVLTDERVDLLVTALSPGIHFSFRNDRPCRGDRLSSLLKDFEIAFAMLKLSKRICSDYRLPFLMLALQTIQTCSILYRLRRRKDHLGFVFLTM